MSASLPHGSDLKKAQAIIAVMILALGIILLPPLVRSLWPPELPRTMLNLHQTPRALPQFEFYDAVGNKLTLKDFRGTFILLNIWATWCPPCKQEMPSLNRLASRFAAKDLIILPLSIDVSGVPTVRYFYEKMDLDKLPIYIDTSSNAMHVLGAVGVPTTLLIDRDGLEIGRLIGAVNWDAPEIIDQLSKTMRVTATE